MRFFNKSTKQDFFYLNQYKTISHDIIKFLPFDTEHHITQEIVGKSVYAVKQSNTRFIYTRHNERCPELEYILRTEMKYNYIIDKYSTKNILEFKLYNNVVYLVNMFNSKDGCMSFSEMKRIADQLDIATPKEINSFVFTQGKKLLDNFYNDYYLNNTNFVADRNYYITFSFKNKKQLLYKLS